MIGRAAFAPTALVAESFVDPEQFVGTCYKVAAWHCPGPTAGFARDYRDFYRDLDAPKQLWVRLLHPQARQWLSADNLPEALQPYEKPLRVRCTHNPQQLASLRARFAAEVTEFRKGQGKRHRIVTVLSIAACAKMAGVIGGYGGIASDAKNLTRTQRRALHCWFNEKTGKYEAPSRFSTWSGTIGGSKAGCTSGWTARVLKTVCAFATKGRFLFWDCFRGWVWPWWWAGPKSSAWFASACIPGGGSGTLAIAGA